ncbi:MAG: N-acetylmuramidase domain-containing protein [Sterolibacterium sp.]
MTFVGKAVRATRADFERTAARLGTGVAEVLTINRVEAPRGPFYTGKGAHKNAPTILFEPHVFYRNLRGKQRAEAMRRGLAAKSQGAIPYGSYPSQYAKLERAILINEEAAYKATSWGGPQILGENAVDMGFSSAKAMAEAFADSESVQLNTMATFVIKNGLAAKLRARDWAGFARGYNGPGYRKNNYDGKLRNAFAIISKEESRRVPPKSTKPEPAPESDWKLDKEKVLAVQQRLKALGYHEVGSADGRWGSRTRGALLAFKADNDLPLDETMTDEIMAALMSAEPREVAPERATITPDELAEKSRTASGSRGSKFWAWIMAIPAMIGSAAQGASEYLGDAAEKLGPVRDVFTSIPGWAWALGIAGIAVAIWRQANKAEKAMLEDYRAGVKP